MSRKSVKHNLPGSIYKNGNRYWWKVKLPGETKKIARPLKPLGSRQATTDYNVAIECAKMMLAESLLKTSEAFSGEVCTIAELVRVYLEHAKQYYKDQDGNITAELKNIRYSLQPLIDLYSSTNLETFGPLMVVKVREKMIEDEIVRKTINQRIDRIRRMFRWGVSMQHVSAVIYQALMTVDGLKRGRTNAKEGKKVEPVDEKYVYAILPYTTKVVAAMIELQLLTGMRPGELVQMKPKHIDRSGQVWHYYPERHKNEYRGLQRIISIGPRGQEILRPFLLRPENDYCFSPAESEKLRRIEMTLKRKTPLSCGNRVGTNRVYEPQRVPGVCYDSCSYGKSVRQAVDAARKEIKAKGGNPDKELPMWTPYQLRHTAATKARKIFNYETAGALLGHSNMSATAIYAERNQGLADEVAKKIG